MSSSTTCRSPSSWMCPGSSACGRASRQRRGRRDPARRGPQLSPVGIQGLGRTDGRLQPAPRRPAPAHRRNGGARLLSCAASLKWVTTSEELYELERVWPGMTPLAAGVQRRVEEELSAHLDEHTRQGPRVRHVTRAQHRDDRGIRLSRPRHQRSSVDSRWASERWDASVRVRRALNDSCRVTMIDRRRVRLQADR